MLLLSHQTYLRLFRCPPYPSQSCALLSPCWSSLVCISLGTTGTLDRGLDTHTICVCVVVFVDKWVLINKNSCAPVLRWHLKKSIQRSKHANVFSHFNTHTPACHQGLVITPCSSSISCLCFCPLHGWLFFKKHNNLTFNFSLTLFHFSPTNRYKWCGWEWRL